MANVDLRMPPAQPLSCSALALAGYTAMKNIASRIIELHDSATPADGLRLCLGDGYLLQDNMVYRRIRERVLRDGYRFCHSNGQAVAALNSVRLLALPTILRLKEIPYRDNVTGLRHLLSSGLLKHNRLDALRPFTERSSILHESAHCVAKEIVGDGVELKPAPCSKRRLLRTLVAEAFAIAVEFVASILAATPADRFFFSMNSTYIALRRERTVARSLMRRAGSAHLSAVMLFGFLAANFLRDKRMVTAFEQSMELLGYRPVKSLQVSKELFCGAVRLSPRFRTQTAAFYFKALNVRREYVKIIDFDYLTVLRKDAELCSSVGRLLETLSGVD
jgi:hypothetical protein